MNDDELERRVAGLFEEVSPPEGMHRWDAGELAPGSAPRHSPLVRLPSLRRADGRWGPLALAVGLAVAAGLVGATLGGIQLSRGGGQSGGPAGSGAGGPSGRFGAAVAYDPATHEVILFGGRDSSGKVLGDTWAWNGSSWRLLQPASSPPARAGAGMAWDSASGRLVLAGGMVDPRPAAANSSINSCPTTTAAAGNVIACASGAGACPQPQTQGAVTCAEIPVVNPILDDTWIFDGSDWRQEHPAHPVTTIGPASMAGQPGGGVVLIGLFTGVHVGGPCETTGSNATTIVLCGDPSNASTDVVRWDGHDWSSLPSIPAVNPMLATLGDTVVAVPANPFVTPAQTAPNAPCSLVVTVPPPQVQSGLPLPPGTTPGGPPPVAPNTTASPFPPPMCTPQIPTPPAVPPTPPASAPAPDVLTLRNGAWVRQPGGGSGPQGVAALTGEGAQLLAIDANRKTWTWDGRSWRDTGSPPLSYRLGGALTVDTDRNVAVMVGGAPAAAVPTLEWNGSAWQLRAGTVPSPPGQPSILPAPASYPPAPPSFQPAPAVSAHPPPGPPNIAPESPPAKPSFSPIPPVP
jgi:hypothetical protein